PSPPPPTGWIPRKAFCALCSLSRLARGEPSPPLTTMSSMGLSLIAGPANAGKVTRLLALYLADLDRDPFLIVPSRSDGDRGERELLAQTPALFGGKIGTFDDLFGQIARAGNGHHAPTTDVQRGLLLRRAVRTTSLNGLVRSARFSGFPDALGAAGSELRAGPPAPLRPRGLAPPPAPP